MRENCVCKMKEKKNCRTICRELKIKLYEVFKIVGACVCLGHHYNKSGFQKLIKHFYECHKLARTVPSSYTRHGSLAFTM
jgi:hypothetical protein